MGEPKKFIVDLQNGGHVELLLVTISNHSVSEQKIKNLKFGAYFEVSYLFYVEDIIRTLKLIICCPWYPMVVPNNL